MPEEHHGSENWKCCSVYSTSVEVKVQPLCFTSLQNSTDSPVDNSYVRGSYTDKEQSIFRVYGAVRPLGENIRRCVKKLGI